MSEIIWAVFDAIFIGPIRTVVIFAVLAAIWLANKFVLSLDPGPVWAIPIVITVNLGIVGLALLPFYIAHRRKLAEQEERG